MVTVERTTYIAAPMEKVVEFLRPEHLTEIWPGMIDVTDVQELPDGGVRYRYHFKLAGFKVEGESETVELSTGQDVYRRTQKNSGHVTSTIAWIMTRDGDSATTVKVKADYEIPQFMLSKLAEPLIRRLNEREADAMLWNLKDRVESSLE